MKRAVYIWETEGDIFAFASETLEAGKRRFAKRYSNVSLDDTIVVDFDDATVVDLGARSFRYIDDHGEPALGWVYKVEFVQEEEE